MPANEPDIYTDVPRYANASIYWDDQDPRTPGWAYRYTDAGTEQSGSVPSSDPDETETTLVALATEIPRECGTVRVVRAHDDADRGRVYPLPDEGDATAAR